MGYSYSGSKLGSPDSNQREVKKSKGIKGLAKVLISSVVLATSVVVVEAVVEPQTVEAATTYTVVNTNTLNVRKGAGTNYGILGTVKKNAKLDVQGTSGNWYKITFNGKIGYVSKSYIKVTNSTSSSSSSSSSSSTAVASGYTYTATANVNVRSTNSTSGKVLGIVKKNDKLTVQAKVSNGWYKISFNGKTGYVSGSYVKETKKDTNIFTMDVPMIRQNPELPAGCEVTSLAMALRYKGVKKDKMTLAREMPYTKTLDPNKGYVGSPYNGTGYTINPVKLQDLAKAYRANSKDLTGASITTIEDEVRKGNPVLVWYTIGYVDVKNINNYKYQNNKKYWWPQPLHCIVITGVGQENFYINDPLNGNKSYGIAKTRFNKIYTDMGKRALVVR